MFLFDDSGYSSKNGKRCVKLGCFLTLFCVVACSLFFYLFEGVYREYKLNEYEFVEYIPNKNVSLHSFTVLSIFLPKEEYISYWDGDNFVIISSLTDDEFECTGECICRTEEDSKIVERRGVSVLLRSTLLFVVSAISVTMAISVSGEYFREKCISEMSKSCESSEIFSEVKTCSKRIKRRLARKNRFYDCFGVCQPNEKLTYEDCVIARSKFDCEDYVIDKIIELEYDDDGLYTAKIEFMRKILAPYCRKISFHEYIYTKGEYQTLRTCSLCVPFKNKGPARGYRNIHCKYMKGYKYE